MKKKKNVNRSGYGMYLAESIGKSSPPQPFSRRIFPVIAGWKSIPQVNGMQEGGKEDIPVEKKKRNKSPVIWTATYDRLRKRWKNRFVMTNLFYFIIIGCLGFVVIQEGKTKEFLVLRGNRLEEYKTKETIYSILRSRGVSLNQGLDIAEVTIRQSKSLDIPMSLILAVMKKESMFVPHAISSQNAMGLMQVHPITWGEYIVKLNLNVSAHAAFDPVTNIVVATHVIKDLYEYYKRPEKTESEIWNSVLSAYYAGRTSFSQTGMTESHLRYVADIKRYKGEFDEKFKD
jgi:hypothetical protein